MVSADSSNWDVKDVTFLGFGDIFFRNNEHKMRERRRSNPTDGLPNGVVSATEGGAEGIHDFSCKVS